MYPYGARPYSFSAATDTFLAGALRVEAFLAGAFPVSAPAPASASARIVPTVFAPAADSAVAPAGFGSDPGSTAMAISVISSAASPRQARTVSSPWAATSSYFSRALTAYSAATPTRAGRGPGRSRRAS